MSKILELVLCNRCRVDGELTQPGWQERTARKVEYWLAVKIGPMGTAK